MNTLSSILQVIDWQNSLSTQRIKHLKKFVMRFFKDLCKEAMPPNGDASRRARAGIVNNDEYGGPSMPKTKPTTVDEYIKAAPKEAQEKLREIRAVLKKVVPGAK